MLAETAFSFADASVFQVIAIRGRRDRAYAFFVWVVWLVRQ